MEMLKLCEVSMSSVFWILALLSLGANIAPSSGFFEVGFSSYLRNTVEHSPESGWLLLRPWHVTTAGRGFFESTFIAPEPGIYYVAVNLRMADVYCGFLKASVVLNSEFDEHSGLSGIYGNTKATGALSITGLLHLFVNDKVAVYLHGSGGKVLSESTFSVVRIATFSSVPGFYAALQQTQVVQPHGWTHLENWETGGTKGLFQMHTGFSPSVGRFCAILGGVYLFTANVNIESSQHATTYVLGIVSNSGFTVMERHISGTENCTSGFSSIFYLHRESCVELRIRQTSQGSLTVRSGSGFSGIFLGLRNDFPQFSATLLRPNQEAKLNGWNLLSGWSQNISRGNFQSDETTLKETSSTFESRESRLFLITATVNINVSLSGGEVPIHLLISVNGPPSGLTGNGGLFAGKTSNFGSQSLSVSGVVLLKKGDTVAVYVYKEDNTALSIDGHFGVSMVSYDWPGVAASLKENVPLTSSGWTAVTSWMAHGTTGLFSFDNAFSPASGKYRANLDGVYFVSCNAVFKGIGGGALSVLIAVDEVLDAGRGLYSHLSNPKHDVTINVAGSIKVSRGQNVSVFVRADDVSSWTVSKETGFSLVLIGAESFSATGFLAKKQQNTNFTSSSWEEVGGWSRSEADAQPFFEAGGQFNSTSGQFKAMEDGLYLVSANILLSHPGSTSFTTKMVLDGRKTKNSPIHYFQQQPSGPPNGDSVNTLAVAGVMHLGPGQRVSIFIKPNVAVSWSVLANSSFSVVMVACWQSANSAGLLALKYAAAAGLTGFGQIPYWTTVSSKYDSIFSKSLTITAAIRVRISHSGLYFAQTVLTVTDVAGNETYRGGLCVNKQLLANGVTASKKSEGSRGEVFSISAYGVLYLRKGDEVTVCTDSSIGQRYSVRRGGGFSLVRFLPLAVAPGLHQHAPAPLRRDSRNSSSLGTWFVIRSWLTGGNRFYINNDIFNPNPILSSSKGVFSAPLSGRYFISAMMVLKADAPTHVLTCVGPHNCTTCYLGFSQVVRKGSDSVSFVGFADLGKDEAISICMNSSVSYERASRSVQFLSSVDATNTTIVRTHERIDFSSSGWHKLEEWKSSDGLGTPGRISISHSGLYIVSSNLGLNAVERGVVGLRFEVTGPSSAHEILAVLSSTGTDGVLSLSVAALARLASSEDVIVSAFTNSSSLSIPGNFTFIAALVSNATQSSCFSVRCRQSSYKSHGLWSPIAAWLEVDLRCVSPFSDATRGRFVADVAGVYFVAAVVVVQTFGSSLEERTIELLLSINGDVEESNSLKATRTLKDGLSTVLSISSSIYLEQWDTVYLMVRSDGAGTFGVGNGSTFDVALMDEKRFYKRVATNLSRFDNGPQIVRHPPPFVRLGGDLGWNVSWNCDAVAGNRVTYKWLRDHREIASSQDLVLRNVGVSDSGRYVCVAQSDNIGVTSRASELEVIDTTPQFENNTYTVEVSEDGTVSLELPFTAVNPQGISSNVSVRITEGDTNDTFEVFPSISSRHSFLRSRRRLNFEEVNLYVLTLEATNLETNKNATVNVTVAVTDVNDNSPVFSNSYYNISLWENVTVGAVVFRTNATDKDSANHSMISYSFVSGQADGAFAISRKSGNVTTTAGLDREAMGDVTLCIQATDGKYVAVTKLLITILDVNEFAPVFFPLNYTRRVSESVLLGEPVVQVFAADCDAEANREIFYNITSGNADDTFIIDSTNGTIFLQKALDYERRKSYELRVKASDGEFGSPEFASVVVDVVDDNDNNPVFEQPAYSFSVPENATVRSLVGRVKAGDNDSYENGVVAYSLSVVGDYEKFKINSSTGEIFTAARLDFEKARNYFILVEASDRGHPPRLAATLVNISTTDVNDQSPECRPCDYSASITEATTVGTPVVRVFFEDRDSLPHSKMSYTISDGNVNETFNITEEGAIVLHKRLDRESVPMYNLSVDASNKGGSALKSREPAIVNIIVTDANDNYPEFSARSYSTAVLEDVPPGSSIMEVKAQDRDSGLNSHVTYSFADSPCCTIASEMFSINATSGCITTRTKLKWSRSLSEYQFQVKASDHGSPTLVSYANVRVTVEDVNDSPPVFTPRVYRKVFERPPDPDTVLVRVTFTDADNGSNADNALRIKARNFSCDSNFTITPDGNISSRCQLQYDCTYSLEVSAEDSAGMDTCTVIIGVGERPPAETVTEKQTGFIPKEGEVALLIIVVIFFLLLMVIVVWFAFQKHRKGQYLLSKNLQLREKTCDSDL